jgi:hypothetical protein
MRDCPYCGVSLQGEPICKEHMKFYGGATHYERAVLVEISEVYDGGLYWACPDCGGTWHRFPVGHPLRADAERFVK